MIAEEKVMKRKSEERQLTMKMMGQREKMNR